MRRSRRRATGQGKSGKRLRREAKSAPSDAFAFQFCMEKQLLGQLFRVARPSVPQFLGAFGDLLFKLGIERANLRKQRFGFHELAGKAIIGDQDAGEHKDHVAQLSQTHILRKKIEEDASRPRYLKSVWGKGYLFDPEGKEE